MFSFHKTLLFFAVVMMGSETSARIAPSSSEQHQHPIARKLQECEANCGSCEDDNVEVTFLDFLDLSIFDTIWEGVVICLPQAVAEIADSINLGTCCKEEDRIGAVQGRPLETEEGLLN
jgi:hypothetical protein